MKLTQRILIVTLALFITSAVSAQPKEIVLDKGWTARRAMELKVDGTVISSPRYQFTGWMEAVVPGTVLTTLLHNDVFPDPFIGMNNELIPDIYETGPEYYTFWFHNAFTLAKPKPGQQVWLNFRGINYRAEIFLNGRRVNHDTHEGMFLRQKYLVTPFLSEDGNNSLAVIVHPPDPVGNPNGGQGGDGTIARSVTQQYTPGWDWVAPVRDRNTGIWDKVSLEITGSVDLRHPWVKTRVPGVRIPGGNQQPAFLDVSAEVVNASDVEKSGVLTAEWERKPYQVSFTLAPGETKMISFPEIRVENPRLWWPNGMGSPEMYDIAFKVEENGSLSDYEIVSVGIRQADTYFDEESGGRVFQVNGQKVFIKGGNWISSDLLLRHTPERYEAEVRMHARMNMNMIRIWGGSITERPEFYNACDRMGILVWQDLWVTGDCNGRWFDAMKKDSQARRQVYPDDQSLFIASVIDQVKMLRNHPSLYFWCGGNEFPPPPYLNDKLAKEIFPTYDGTRYYLNESTGPDLLRNTIGGGGDGPYGIQDPARFFNTPSYPFNPEIGSVGMPNVETMRRMMSGRDLNPPVDDRPNNVWRYHKFIGYGGTIEAFGEIKGVEDYCKKAQVVNYEQYRALQEGFNAGMWNAYTGMLVWKNQNPWTALRGQFYDVYLDQNGGFYGYMHGARPLHVQLNLNDTSLCVVNQTLKDASGLVAEAHLYSLQGALLGKEVFRMDVNSNTWKVAGKLKLEGKPEGLHFVRLLLKDAQGREVDENLYWLTSRKEDFKDLEKLKPAKLELQVKITDRGKVAVIRNSGNETAFFTRLRVVHSTTGELALPVFMDDNYLTLFPGEEREIGITWYPMPGKAGPGKLVVQAEPWSGPVLEVEL